MALHLIAVALNNGTVVLYNGPDLIHVITSSDPISSMVFGTYGREEHALILVSTSNYFFFSINL
jgi:hypothetical protein